jgi:hypothetical protein
MIPHIIKKEIIQIHAEDLQELIKNIYNKGFDVIKSLENGYNNTDYNVYLKRKDTIGYYEKIFSNWFENNIVDSSTLDSILKDLMWKDELVEGEYLIKTDKVLKSTKSICLLFLNYLSKNNLIDYSNFYLIKEAEILENFINEKFNEIYLIEK